MTYGDKITRLNPEEFFSLFEDLHAEPRWVNSRGKQSIQVLGLCHHGENHSALFDPKGKGQIRISEHGGTPPKYRLKLARRGERHDALPVFCAALDFRTIVIRISGLL